MLVRNEKTTVHSKNFVIKHKRKRFLQKNIHKIKISGNGEIKQDVTM